MTVSAGRRSVAWRGRFSSEIWNRSTLNVLSPSTDWSSVTNEWESSSSFSARERPYWKSKLPFHSRSLLKVEKLCRTDSRWSSFRFQSIRPNSVMASLLVENGW